MKDSGLSFSGRRKFWQLFTAHAVNNPDNDPAQRDFDRFLAEVKGLGAAVENGSVTLVGAGPGDPELLTLRAVRALQSADVILFDDLVSRDVLDFARREASNMLVGKTGFGPSCKQDDINALMVSLAKQGKRVVRLKGGDPLIFGRAAEEIAACRGGGDRGRRRARHHRGARRGEPARHSAHRPHACPPAAICHRPRQGRRAARRYRLAQPRRSGDDHGDLYAGARRWPRLVEQGHRPQGLDPQTPALAIASATRPNQAVVCGPDPRTAGAPGRRPRCPDRCW